MFKLIKKIIKWIIRIVILAAIVFALIFVYRFLINGVTGQAGKKCQEITASSGGGKEVVYTSLADWIKTQSTSLVKVDDATYKNDAKKGDQIVVKYSLYGNIYSGEKTLSASTLEKFCGI